MESKPKFKPGLMIRFSLFLLTGAETRGENQNNPEGIAQGGQP
jgi:hypothetical protein